MSPTHRSVQADKLLLRLSQHPRWGAHPSRRPCSCPCYLVPVPPWQWYLMCQFCHLLTAMLMVPWWGKGSGWKEAGHEAGQLQGVLGGCSITPRALTLMPIADRGAQPGIPSGVCWTESWALSQLPVLYQALTHSAALPKEVKH